MNFHLSCESFSLLKVKVVQAATRNLTGRFKQSWRPRDNYNFIFEERRVERFYKVTAHSSNKISLFRAPFPFFRMG